MSDLIPDEERKAGFRRVSPVTREALVKTVASAQAEYQREDLPEDGLTESETIADAILSRFSLPEPAETERRPVLSPERGE